MIFIFIIGLLFFGYGTVILFKKQNYKPAIGSLAFSIFFIFGIFSISSDSKEEPQLDLSGTTEENIITPKEDSIQEKPGGETKEPSLEEKVQLTDAGIEEPVIEDPKIWTC